MDCFMVMITVAFRVSPHGAGPIHAAGVINECRKQTVMCAGRNIHKLPMKMLVPLLAVMLMSGFEIFAGDAPAVTNYIPYNHKYLTGSATNNPVDPKTVPKIKPSTNAPAIPPPPPSGLTVRKT